MFPFQARLQLSEVINSTRSTLCKAWQEPTSSLRCLLTAELSLQRLVKVADPPDLLFDAFSFLADLQFVRLHPFVHFVEGVPLLVEVSVLLGQDLLVLVQKVPKLVQLGVLEDLEPSERRGNLIRGRYFGHLGDRLVQQMVLAFNKGVIVLQHVLQLMYTRVCRSSSIILVCDSELVAQRVFSLVEHCHAGDLLVNSAHEVFEALEVELELRDKFPS